MLHFFPLRLRQASSSSKGPWALIGVWTLPGAELQPSGRTERPSLPLPSVLFLEDCLCWTGWLFANSHRHVPWGHQKSTTGEGQSTLFVGGGCLSNLSLIQSQRICHHVCLSFRTVIPDTSPDVESNFISLFRSPRALFSEDVVFHQNGEHLTNLWPSTHVFF